MRILYVHIFQSFKIHLLLSFLLGKQKKGKKMEQLLKFDLFDSVVLGTWLLLRSLLFRYRGTGELFCIRGFVCFCRVLVFLLIFKRSSLIFLPFCITFFLLILFLSNKIMLDLVLHCLSSFTF